MILLLVGLLSVTGGLRGTVVIDPARPVCEVGQSCSRPDKRDVLLFRHVGRLPVKTRTDGRGHFRVTLAPGRYVVTAPEHRAIGRGLEPRRVIVPRGRYARVNFTLDIGIR